MLPELAILTSYTEDIVAKNIVLTFLFQESMSSGHLNGDVSLVINWWNLNFESSKGNTSREPQWKVRLLSLGCCLAAIFCNISGQCFQFFWHLGSVVQTGSTCGSSKLILRGWHWLWNICCGWWWPHSWTVAAKSTLGSPPPKTKQRSHPRPPVTSVSTCLLLVTPGGSEGDRREDAFTRCVRLLYVSCDGMWG